MKNRISEVTFGVVGRIVDTFVPVRRKEWVFGAACGNAYREGSKYLFEYMLERHPEYRVTFVTRSKTVYDELRAKHLPCAYNFSLSGVVTIARAECVFTTNIAADIFFAHKKKGRRFFYLVHGQPYKVAQLALAKTGFHKRLVGEKRVSKFSQLVRKVKELLHTWIVCDHGNGYSEFVSATSEFLQKWMDKDFDGKTPVKILGMPRNDALFQPERMRGEKWIDGTEGKFVISYMPTHRLYGRGKFSPAPFASRPDVQQWMRDNNVVFVVKNHPTMLLYQGYTPIETECIKDVTDRGIDPMTVVCRSDVLVTDYSSVWMDYLLMRRPIIFYIYDDFEHDDAGVYYDVKEERVGHFCYSENELFELLKTVKAKYDEMRPSEEVLRKFHKYADGNSCERYFNYITANEANAKGHKVE